MLTFFASIKNKTLCLNHQFIFLPLLKRIQNTIEKEGFECVRAESMARASELLKSETFDLGILDVELDEDKRNGFTVAQKIQSNLCLLYF